MRSRHQALAVISAAVVLVASVAVLAPRLLAHPKSVVSDQVITEDMTSQVPDQNRAEVMTRPSGAESRHADHDHQGRYLISLQGGDPGDLMGRLHDLGVDVSGAEVFLETGAVAVNLSPEQVASLNTGAPETAKGGPSLRIEPDQVVHASGTNSPVGSWGLDRLDQDSLPLNNSYTYNPGPSSVTAYVVDTGIYSDHTQFTGRLRSGYDAIGGGSDCNGHGTHVAGTIGGSTYGVAPTVELVAVRVLDCAGSGWDSDVIGGIDWVISDHVSGPAVMNISLGGGISATLDAVINRAVADGITVVIAAGNSNDDACTHSPARVPDAVTVGASTSTDQRASFSNWGSCVDLFAPGQLTRSAYIGSTSASAVMSGTSMASPHVAGVAALISSWNPTWTPAQVAAQLNSDGGRDHLSDVSGSPNVLARVRDHSTPTSTTTSTTSSSTTSTSTTSTSTTTTTPSRGVTVSLLNPSSGKVGTQVAITGTNFTGVTSVKFSGVQAQYTVNSSTQLRATVPSGATTGYVVVTTTGGSGTSATRFTVSGSYIPLAPARVMDTRPGGSTADGQAVGEGALTSGGSRQLKVTGRGGVPSTGVTAVALNVTVTGPTEAGYLTVYPWGVPRPNASNLNFLPGQTVPNMVIAKVSPEGFLGLFNSAGSTHVVVDVLGWFQGTEAFAALTPARLMDSRSGMPTTDGISAGGGAIGEGASRPLQVGGRGGVPASGVGAVVLNVTVTEPTAPGYLSVYPWGESRPNASSLNFQPGQTVPNLVIAKVSSAGYVSLFNSAGDTHVVVDVVGWFPG